MPIKLLWRVLNPLLQALIIGDKDNKGAAFRVNVDPKWEGTLAIRCNHILLSKIPAYVGMVISQVVVNDCPAWWEHTSIARCFDFQKLNGKRHNNPRRKTIYFTFRLPEETLNAILTEWPESNFRDLRLLVEWLKERSFDEKEKR